MRWGNIMTAVCYDVLNQVLFDKTVLSTSVFIVSPVSPSTKAGWWYVSVLVLWGVWGSALERPAHLSGPRAEVVWGYGITGGIVVNLNLWNVKKKANISFILLSRSKLFRENSLRTKQLSETSSVFNCFFMLLIFMNEKAVHCLSNVGRCSLFKQRAQMWDDMFGFSQQLNSFWGGDGLQAFPLSSAVWMGCHTD